MKTSRAPKRSPSRGRHDARGATSSTIAGLLTLRASGDRSFEELVARLLSSLSGQRIRRCTAGTQDGVDALAEIPFAIEDKRKRRLLGSAKSRAG